MTSKGFARVAFAWLVTLSLGLVACHSGRKGEGAGREPRVLRWAIDFPANWDPVVQGSGGGFRVLALAYASLTEIDEQGNARPGLAQSWDYNAAGDEITFHLRPNQKFADGTPVDAEAIKLYLERAKTQPNSALAGDLTSIESARVTSDLDITLHLTQVDHQIPLLLGQRVAQITSPTAARDLKKLNGFPVGAGPFKVVELVPESHVFLKKNPDYWDAEHIFIDEVRVFAGTDPATVVSSVKTGVYDFATLAPSQIKAARDAGLDVLLQPGFNASNIAINIHKKPFTDPAVVEAVHYAINRQEFVDKAMFGNATATNQPFPKGYVAYDDASEKLWPYNPSKAKEILKDAGYQPGQINVDFVVPTPSATAEIVQSQLAAVGIVAHIVVSPNWAQPFFAKELALSLYGTTGRESPVQTLTAHFGPEGPLNLSAPFVSQEFLDSPSYAANLKAATRIALKTTPMVFTCSFPNAFVKGPRVPSLPAIPGQIHWTGVKLRDTGT
jgi:peptide/nickel transport system substrate-binding protein